MRKTLSIGKFFLFSFTLGLALIATTVVILEIALRLLDYSPWTPSPMNESQPALFEFDAIRGWRNKPGTHSFPPYPGAPEAVTVSVLPDGSRATATSPRDDGPIVVTVGGSFTYGWAVSDAESWPWKLADELPSFTVINHGVGGYGTYQSLLTLEEILPKLSNPRLVIYGMIDHHESRNVGSPHWLEALSKLSRRGHVQLPRCELDSDGRLIREPLEKYPETPLRECSALITVLEKLFFLIGAGERESLSGKITRSLLLEMNELAKSHDVRLLVVLLEMSEAKGDDYFEFLKKNRISVVDCAADVFKEPVFKVPVDGHPNAKLHSIWADRIAEAARRMELTQPRN